MIRLMPLLLLLVAAAPMGAHAGQVYTIGISCAIGDKCKAPELENTLAEAYARAGFETRFVYAPRLRDLQQANSGATDATAVCSEEALPDHPNLRLLPTPLIQTDLRAYSLDPEVVIASRDDLASYDVGVIRGQFIAVKLARDSAAVIHEVNTLENLFNMLQLGRLDAIILNRASAIPLLAKNGIVDYTESASLGVNFLYHAINKDAFTPEEAAGIDAALLEMLQEGTTRRLFGRYQDMVPTLPLHKDR